jgi:hypothetical protein
MFLLPKTISKSGSALMATIMVMMGLAALISFTSEQAIHFLETQRTGAIETHLQQVEESLLQSLQVSYYEHYHQTKSDSSGIKTITNAELDLIVQSAYSRIGVAGISGATVSIPHSSGSIVESLIQCSFPNSVTEIDTQSTTPYEPIQGTYSWLDGIFAVQKSIQVTLTLTGKNAFSGKTRSLSHQYQVRLLEIPVENLSISSMGNVTLTNIPITAGSGYIAGSIQGGSGVRFQNRLISGNRSESSVTTPEAEGIRHEGWSDRGYSEIVSTNTVRDLTQQRTPALGTSLKTSYFFREGLASNAGFSAAERSQLRSNQPYYKVPVTQRIYGTHHPLAADESSAFTSNPGSGDEQNTVSLPSWSTLHLETNGTPKVQFMVDLSQIPPDSNNEIHVFVGSRNQSPSGSFTQAEVIILPWENIPPDLKISLISPNPIVITGNFNQGASPGSVHFFGNRVYYGSSASSQINFEGTYSTYQQSNAGGTINFQSSDGSIPSIKNIIMNQNGTGIIHSNHHYYYLVIKSGVSG